MEQFKFDNFNKEYPGIQFPEINSLSVIKQKELQIKLKELLAINKTSDLLTLVKKINISSKIIDKFNADKFSFILLDTLKYLDVKFSSTVYINWYRFDDIDEIKLSELSKYFSDIWYPGTDDINIFDASLMWILSVRHDGTLSFLKLS